jgi:CheY-like chemotaxis protein/HPt (histidine-containing phosphotransfer) domain-containing protein
MSNHTQPDQIMVVDDDEVSREVLALLLQAEGYAVDAADSGDAALVKLKSADSKPGIVLTDMQMPGTVGAELSRQLRAVCGAGTRLLAMSGNQPDEEATRGFDGFLLKPFTMAQLAAAIANGTPSVEPEAVPTATILNEAVYEKLARSMKPVQLEQLYTLCLADAEKRIAEMRRAASKGDDPTYRREAHAIKGGCGMVGATELQSIATAMETHGMGAANHVASLDEFLLACERLRRILIERERN